MAVTVALITFPVRFGSVFSFLLLGHFKSWKHEWVGFVPGFDCRHFLTFGNRLHWYWQPNAQ